MVDLAEIPLIGLTNYYTFLTSSAPIKGLNVQRCVHSEWFGFMQLPPGSVDTEILHDATRREARGG